MLFTSVLAEMEIAVLLEVVKRAVSDGLLGTVAGDQLAAVFQSPVAGLRRHLALPALLVSIPTTKSVKRTIVQNGVFQQCRAESGVIV
jgi:hypothetical protein